MMKVLHLNSDDIKFGAGKAAYRLHRALLDSGIDSRMLVEQKYSDDPTVVGLKSNIFGVWNKLILFIDKLPLLYYRAANYNNWNLNWFPRSINADIASENPDIVHLHWVGNNLLPISSLTKISLPIVWTFHDMWAFTGGCHYTLSCTRYRENCGMCPQLHSRREFDISRWNWKRKYSHWRNIDFKIVALNNWMMRAVRESTLLKDKHVTIIPNCLDLNIFKPFNKKAARQKLELPSQKKLILFGAIHSTSDSRKGYSYLQPSLHKLAYHSIMSDAELVVFGASRPHNDTQSNFKTHYRGVVSDEVTLALLYSAADVFIAPSIQDNLPNTVLEATACGTPSVAFNIGGLPDLIEHKNTGYLAEPFSTEDLGNGIIWILEEKDRYRMLARNAREKAEREFSPEIVAKKHINLYNYIMNKK
jgi:glycosyltransferase involved in cell wall biosynthesis